MAPEDGTENDEALGVADEHQPQYSEEQSDTIAHDPHVSVDVQDEESDDGGDYDPESVAIETTPATGGEAAPPRASSKPKMTGGFIVEASDDEDDGTPQPRAVSQKQMQPAQQTGSSTSTPAPAPGGPSMPPTVAGMDPVAFLEARIKEDPRGDMDAWLNLMAEYKRRSNMDELRKVYHRFLEVFPQAVRIISP